ncbi:MAG TPA: hypothetical protein VGF99_15250 [Myxococcota bacterium]
MSLPEPLVDGPPHMVSPDGRLLVWFVEPLGIVDVHLGGNFTAAQARFLTVDAQAVLERLAAARQEKASFVHLWGDVERYDGEARTQIIQWGLGWGPSRVHQIWVVLGPRTPAIMRMACSMGKMAMTVARIHLEITEDVEVVRQRLPLRRLHPSPLDG